MTKSSCKLSNRKVVLHWSEKAVRAFNTLEDLLTEEATLSYPNFTKIFVLNTDASKFAIGGILQQHDGKGHLRPITFFSRTLNESEVKYSTVEREALAVVYGLTVNRPIILGGPVKVASDHRPHIWLFNYAGPNLRILRRQMAVADFELEVIYIAGKQSSVGDALSRLRSADHPIDNIVVLAVTRGGKKKSANVSLDNVIMWDPNKVRINRDAHPQWSQVKRYSILYHTKLNVIFIPDSYKNTLYLAHSLPLSGHGGVQVTLERFLKRFPDVKEKFEYVHLDLVGPLPTSNEGAKYVLTVIDVLTLLLIAIDRHTTTPFHPSSNGLVDGTIMQILRSMAIDNPGEWDTMLPLVVCHRTVHDSPHFLMYNKDPSVPYFKFFHDSGPWYNVDDLKLSDSESEEASTHSLVLDGTLGGTISAETEGVLLGEPTRNLRSQKHATQGHWRGSSDHGDERPVLDVYLENAVTFGAEPAMSGIQACCCMV
ncbi:uncharacterized protein LOC122244582 [Penaeus japonicus]|uniref:uncharacterized protein LOC122244582 n=1 Tax=Penaeus japonicus TaxID=27405 RepID=UPI001C71680A|nr:uncharacterized protein LOC122244582 [Penaeus japonicus]